MAKIRPIQAFRPSKDNAQAVASPPYDVLNSEEARQMAKGNPHSFLRIIKPEIDLPSDLDHYDDQVYNKAKSNFEEFAEQGVLIQDEKPCLYLYQQIMGDHKQIGLVCGSSTEDYFADVIKKHEYTRPVKETDRIRHIMTSGIHAGPVFSAYKNVAEIDVMVAQFVQNNEADTDFVAPDNIRHTIWKVADQKWIDKMVDLFKTKVPATYIADGHHRAASTSKVGRMYKDIKESNKEYTGNEDFNFFLSVLFPDNQLQIIDYNRVVKDLNWHTKEDFISKISEKFEVIAIDRAAAKPKKLNSFGMYLDGDWFMLNLKQDFIEKQDPVESLDVALLQKHLFEPLLGIKDQRTDNRIDFVGGIRGLKELEKRVDSGDMKAAFAIHSVSIKQLFDVADSGRVMPPKSTWFEPKLRSGLIVYKYV